MKWESIETAPKDGTDIIVLIDCASVPLARIARWNDPVSVGLEVWESIGHDDDDVGWWSYRNSVCEEILNGVNKPIAWIPLPETSGYVI